MSRPLTFSFSADKFVNASVYLVRHCPEVTKMKLAKLLYFADVEHLLMYGRPITGDRYIKMEHGPVPSNGYDLIKRNDRASREDQELFDDFLEARGNTLVAKSDPNLLCLSETDIEALDSIVRKFGSATAKQLRDLSHRDQAWIEAKDNTEIDYRVVFVGLPDDDSVKELAQEHQALSDALYDVSHDVCLA